MFTDLLNTLKEELKQLLMSRLMWFLGGIMGSGQNVPSLIDNVKGLFGF